MFKKLLWIKINKHGKKVNKDLYSIIQTKENPSLILLSIEFFLFIVD